MRIECPRRRPAVVQSAAEFQVRHAGTPRPSRHRIVDAVVHYRAHASTIASLRPAQRPHTVSRLVIAIAAFTLERMKRRWSPPHVRKERLERTGPPRTYGDAAPSVTVPEWTIRITATALRSAPCPVFWRPPAAIDRLAVSLKMDRRGLDFPATARFRVPTPKALAGNDCLLPARTATEPTGFSVLGICRTRQHAQPPERRAQKVFVFHHIACHKDATMQRKHGSVKVLSAALEAKDAAVRAQLFI